MAEQPDEQGQEQGQEHAVSARRTVLKLGAATATMAVTVQPALAATAASVLSCQIPVPDPTRAGQYIAPDGSVVPSGTAGAVPPMPRPLTGDEVRTMMRGGSGPAGTSYEQRQAYTNYIRRLQRGTSGFTCYASLQMPRG